MSGAQQIEMFAAQPRRDLREGPRFYAAVLYLRQNDVTVKRVGPRQSLVNGSLIENCRLIFLARKLGWEKETPECP